MSALLGPPAAAQVLSYEGFDYFNTAAANLHLINNGKFSGATVTNWDKSLGWAGDWQQNPSTSAPATVGTATSATYTNGTFDLITAGHFALSGSHSIGRKLQNSPAGPFGRNGTNSSTTNVTNGTDFLTAANFTANGYAATTPAIGRDGTTLWLSFLVRKSTNNDDLAYVSLHRNDGALYDGDTGNHLAAGYFGTASNSAGVRYWSVRVNGTVTQSNVPVVAGAWTLLVARIVFNTAAGTTMTLYVNPTNLGSGTPPGTPNATASAAGGQANTFRHVAWYGGGGGASFLDELRLASDYLSATTSSDKIRVEGEMCGGRLGQNIFTNGNFDEYSPAPSYNPAASAPWSDAPARQSVNNSGPWVDVTAGSYCYINTLNFGGNGGLDDGTYTIANGVRQAWDVWVNSLDVSGTGNLMLANASYRPGVFFRQIPSNSFCESTTYEFSVMVKNVDQPQFLTAYGGTTEGGFITCDPAREPGCEQLSQLDGGIGNTTSRNTDAHGQSAAAAINCATAQYNVYDWHTSGTVGTSVNGRRYRVLPDIEFIINDVVAYSPPAPIPNDGLWHKVGFTFTTKAGVSSLELKIRNKAPGGGGNDIALDNFSFRACGPSVSLDMGNFPACNPPEVFSVIGPGFVGPNFPPTHYRWQKRTGAGSWTDITAAPNAGSYVAAYPHVQQGDSIRVNVASSTSNLGNYFCSVLSDGGKITCIIPLPAELLGLNAVRNAAGVRLTWQTASERNCAYFAVERSVDGIRFVETGRVAAAGNSTMLQAYYLTDVAAPPGKLYYRLRQTDADGSETYSRVVAVNGPSGAPDIALVPNPAHTSVRVVFDTPFAATEQVTLRLLTPLGQVVRRQRLPADARTAELTLPLGNLTAGLYVLEVTTQTQRHLRKLVVETP